MLKDKSIYLHIVNTREYNLTLQKILQKSVIREENSKLIRKGGIKREEKKKMERKRERGGGEGRKKL